MTFKVKTLIKFDLKLKERSKRKCYCYNNAVKMMTSDMYHSYARQYIEEMANLGDLTSEDKSKCTPLSYINPNRNRPVLWLKTKNNRPKDPSQPIQDRPVINFLVF